MISTGKILCTACILPVHFISTFLPGHSLYIMWFNLVDCQGLLYFISFINIFGTGFFFFCLYNRISCQYFGYFLVLTSEYWVHLNQEMLHASLLNEFYLGHTRSHAFTFYLMNESHMKYMTIKSFLCGQVILRTRNENRDIHGVLVCFINP